MSRVRLLGLAVGLATLLPVPVLAHGGGLNASGCHNNRKTGDYHCHRGGSIPPAPRTSPSAPIWQSPYPPARTPAPEESEPFTGAATLISVGDGDTLRVTTAKGEKVTIRLACIDAPETAQGVSGQRATDYLRQAVSQGRLEIRAKEKDRYGRTVAEVYAGGRNVNLELVRAGMAFVYWQYIDGCDSGAYQRAEEAAMRERQGVWRRDQGEQRPWDFRRQSQP